MEDFTQLRLAKFLDRVAARTPAPGGGCVAAGAGALACAMGQMVAAYSDRKKLEPGQRKEVEEVTGRLRRTEELLRALISEDAIRYERMTKAAAAAGNDPSRADAYQEAVLSAIAVPMEVAALASSTLETLDGFKGVASRYLVSDLGVAAVLADATARAAQFTVQVNAAAVKDAPTLAKINTEIDTIVEHCARRRDAIETDVRRRLAEPQAGV